MTDSSVVRVHQHGTGARKKGDSDGEETGRSRGGLTTKVHAITDSEGRIASLSLSSGQVHDLLAVPRILGSIPADTIMLADKAYNADSFIAALKERGICPNIPNWSNRKEKRGFFPSL